MAAQGGPIPFCQSFLHSLLVFGLYPILFSIYLSLHDWDAVSGLSSMKWVGLENYRWLLTDPWFWKSLSNTLILLVVAGLPQHIIAIPLAFVLN